jgi:glycosyltransferase involved in cell wall biosynthesis
VQLQGWEAMAVGLPVITTSESGLPIVDRVNGLLVESKNDDDILKAILELSANCTLRKLLGENAAKKIAENYTWDMYAKKVEKLYLEILNQ